MLLNTLPGDGASCAPTHEIRFEPLEADACGLAFPCDGQGHVDLDALSEPARLSYLFARATVGRRYTRPAVQPAGAH